MNQIIVFSETRQDWIVPQSTPIRVLTERLRRKEGDEYMAKVGTKRIRVRVEQSDNGYWWLVSMERAE